MTSHLAAPPDALTITIPATPDIRCSPNGGRCSERTRIRWRKYWANEAIMPARVARQAVCGFGGGPVYDGPTAVDLHIFWERGRHRQDPSNLWISAKYLLDVLTREAIIADDDQLQTGRVTQARFGHYDGQPQTVLTIRRLDADEERRTG